MRKTTLLFLLLLSTLAGMVQAQVSPPAIITLTADRDAITVAEAEAGETPVTLAWQVVNMSDSHRLDLLQYRLGSWVSVLPADETLPATGTFITPVEHPLDFSPPAYRLVLFDAADQVLGERVLTLPYAQPADTQPEISLFVTSTATILADALTDGSARVNVSWAVENRLPGTNLVFEQVQADGSAVLVELPRGNLWIASQGDGVVAPVTPQQGSLVRVRLRVVDLADDTVYAEAEVEVAVSGTLAAAVPTAAPTTVDQPEPAEDQPTPLPSPTPRNCSVSALDVPLTGTPGDGCDTFRDPAAGTVTRVVDFELDSTPITPGGEITFTWLVEGAQFALLEIYDPRQLAEGGLPQPAAAFYDGLPTSGSTTVTLPAHLSQGARFILWAADLSTDARSPAFLYNRRAYRIIDVGPAGVATAAEILAFVVLPPVVAPGDTVTLSWSLTGADEALIELYNRSTGALAGVFEDLPTLGEATITIPDTFANGARFVLWAADRTRAGDLIRLVNRAAEVPAG
jgi:hypothetical protein